MSLKTDNHQIGLSATASQNFNITTGNDGTMKLARGNLGASIADVLAVAADGVMSAGASPATGSRSLALATMQKFADEFGASLATSGWQRLPSGLIVQWGQGSGTTNAGSSTTTTFPLAFPSSCFQALAVANTPNGTDNMFVGGVSKNVSSASFTWMRPSGGSPGATGPGSGVSVSWSWFAVGN